jgi:hypothetical protein
MQKRASWKIAGGLSILAVLGCMTMAAHDGEAGSKTGEPDRLLTCAAFLFLVALFCVARAFPRPR